MIPRTKAEFFAEMRRKFERTWHHFPHWEKNVPMNAGIMINYEIWQKTYKSDTHLNAFDTRVELWT